eukprot:CAMPEP_0113573762 /NCGR_PEP_ID=MMETSP0015_2-20120614/26794_1 /TAXON_ID=2838 /ORGANISM="Odontella" /LENGTH=229 /DNA_ID=CAMNT_0000476869 /DNA_START=244 /DNA_END=930 /DNA_ORIENTATION=- /assembly_acc=CAM_ASM_000160
MSATAKGCDGEDDHVLERAGWHRSLRKQRGGADDYGNEYAVLVDAENTSPRILGSILSEVSASYGETSIRRLYGDFTKKYLSSWIGLSREHSCELMESFPYTKGKNSSDFAMTIDAMDLLHTEERIDGFCLVSSDSDFTGLALRLRGAGKHVLGIGRCSTPKCFVRACSDFIVTKGRIYEREQGLSPGSVNMLRCIMREVALGGSTEATVDRQLPQGTGVFKGLDRDGW